MYGRLEFRTFLSGIPDKSPTVRGLNCMGRFKLESATAGQTAMIVTVPGPPGP
jgi:hypothetical protein